MSSRAWALLRDARYALPRTVGDRLPAPQPGRVMRRSGGGRAVTLGYFPPAGATPAQIAEANLAAIAALPAGGRLAVKAPAMQFDRAALDRLVQAAQAAQVELIFDSHAPGQADPTFAALDRARATDPATGVALPARWRRSRADAERLRDTPARIRLVKGEWAGQGDEETDPAEGFLELARSLAGRSGMVGIATHDPALAAAALRALLAAGTPCELEQLRGLPSRRVRAVAAALGVPVRRYLPFGPGWWPYAIDKALARPYLPAWWLRDRFSGSPA